MLKDILESGVLLDVPSKVRVFTAGEAVDHLVRCLYDDLKHIETYCDEDFVLMKEKIDAIEFLQSAEGAQLVFKCEGMKTAVMD